MRTIWKAIVGLGIPIDYLLSVALAGVWFCVVLVATSSFAEALASSMVLIIPIGLIWFHESLADFTGPVRMQNMEKSPPSVIRVFGWIALLGLIAFQAYSLIKK